MIDLDTKPRFDAVTLPEDFMALFRPLDQEHKYNNSLVEVLAKTLHPTNDVQSDNLATYVYVGRKQCQRERQEAYNAKMLGDGWIVCDKSAVQEAVNTKKRLEVSATSTMDWLTQRINQVFKPFIHPETGQAYLMKPRARTRGILVQSLDNAFCKLV